MRHCARSRTTTVYMRIAYDESTGKSKSNTHNHIESPQLVECSLFALDAIPIENHRLLWSARIAYGSLHQNNGQPDNTPLQKHNYLLVQAAFTTIHSSSLSYFPFLLTNVRNPNILAYLNWTTTTTRTTNNRLNLSKRGTQREWAVSCCAWT